MEEIILTENHESYEIHRKKDILRYIDSDILLKAYHFLPFDKVIPGLEDWLDYPDNPAMFQLLKKTAYEDHLLVKIAMIEKAITHCTSLSYPLFNLIRHHEMLMAVDDPNFNQICNRIWEEDCIERILIH